MPAPGCARASVDRRDTDGLVNLRDAVVFPTGPVLSRPRLLYRSEAPLPGDRPPRGLLWPPRTVIDLREPAERGTGPHPLAATGARIVDLPMSGAPAPDVQPRLRPAEITLVELYMLLVSTAPLWLPELVAQAGSAPTPVLVHCAGGKDRTGVAVALLLVAAAVPHSAIVADYVRTNEVVGLLRSRLHRAHPEHPEIPDHQLAAPAEAITAVLHQVGLDPAGFHLDHGVAPRDLRRWQRRLWSSPGEAAMSW